MSDPRHGFVSSGYSSAPSVDAAVEAVMAPLEGHVAPMLLVSPQSGRIRHANRAAVALYGREAVALCRMSIDALDTHGTAAVARFRQKAALAGGTEDTRHRLASGEKRAVRLSASPVLCADQPYLLCIVQDMTELEQMHSDLRIRQDQLNLVLGTAVAGYTEVDYETGNVYVSHGMLALMGYSAQTPLGRPATLDELAHPDDVAQVREISRGARDADHVVEYRFRLHHRVETWIWVQAGGTMRYDIAGHPVRFVGTLHDINFAMRIEANLRSSEARYRLMFDASPLPMMVLDQSGERILEANKAAAALYGFVQTSLAGRPSRAILGFGQMALFRRLLASTSSGAIASMPMQHQTLDGRALEVECHCSPLADGDRHQSLILVHDLTERKAAEAVIQRLITLDTLTQLPNRELVLRRLGQSIAYCRRHRKVGILLLVNLDSFRTVNTAVGREFGDALLREVARRLGDATRASDMVARLAGDEFAIVLDQQETSEEAASRAAEAATHRVLESLRQPYRIDGADLFITASIGVVLLDGVSRDGNQVIAHAEAAVTSAKEAGRNTVRFYDANLQSIRDRRVSLEMDLRGALDDEQFRLFYQVQVDQQGLPRGAEVLLRWMHPSRGMVPPLEFVHLAEETGVIHSLGRWVLQQACRKLVQWAQVPALAELTLSVNVSARQFRRPDFAAQVSDLLRETGADPSRLVLELTESLLVDHADQAAARMHELRALGVAFSLDDFGTGYSSMAYLKDLPLSELKIDRTFTHEILTDPSDAVIVRTMIGMARNLGLSMVAEGVETDEQLQALIDWGCDGFQGYLFSRPVPEEEFATVMTALLEAARPARDPRLFSATPALVGPATPRHAEPAKRGRKRESSR